VAIDTLSVSQVRTVSCFLTLVASQGGICVHHVCAATGGGGGWVDYTITAYWYQSDPNGLGLNMPPIEHQRIPFSGRTTQRGRRTEIASPRLTTGCSEGWCGRGTLDRARYCGSEFEGHQIA
jgi:hypothetical protein